MKASLDARDARICAGQIGWRLIGGVADSAADLHIDGRGQALVQHGVLQATGLEVGAEVGICSPQYAPHPVHILVAADLVVFLQRHLHVAVCGPELLV